jgi:hypothetical protein
LQRQYWNAFKHLNTRDGEVCDDDETLVSFDGSKLNEDKLAPGADLDTIRRLFPNIRFASRTDQKRRLGRTVEKYRDEMVEQLQRWRH